MINKEYLYAVVGASQDESKYGFQVLKDLRDADYKVVPINLHEKEILGLKVYPSLKSLPEKADLVIIVVPPQVALEVLEEVRDLKINKVWMQPGSESEEALKYCEEHKIDCISGACIMIQKNK
jgi:predicted CoA-binding protein